MTNSKLIAGLIGPTLVVAAMTEALNLHIWARGIPAVVYLNGLILFVVGLAIVRFHNLWTLGWPVMVTLAGWLLLLGGLYRMAAPEAPQVGEGVVAYVLFAILFVVGGLLTFKAYGRRE